MRISLVAGIAVACGAAFLAWTWFDERPVAGSAPRDAQRRDPSHPIRPAETTVTHRTLVLHRGTIVLTDEHGVPVAGRSIAFDRFGVLTSTFESDAYGRIELEFPTFTGGILDPTEPLVNPNEPTIAPFSWPPASGELRIVWPPR